jgi:hypothetical protein
VGAGEAVLRPLHDIGLQDDPLVLLRLDIATHPCHMNNISAVHRQRFDVDRDPDSTLFYVDRNPDTDPHQDPTLKQ